MKNPYPKRPGFGLRVHRAEKAIRRYGNDVNFDPYTRAFDNCFEMDDGDAVVFALMHKAYSEANQDLPPSLTMGLRRMFSRSLSANGYPVAWEKIANGQGQPEDQLSLL